MSCFVKVIVKGDEYKYYKDFVHYNDDGDLIASNSCPILKKYVLETITGIQTDENNDQITIKLEFNW